MKSARTTPRWRSHLVLAHKVVHQPLVLLVLLLDLLLQQLLRLLLLLDLLHQLRLSLIGLLSDSLFPFFHFRLRRVSRDVINIAMENM